MQRMKATATAAAAAPGVGEMLQFVIQCACDTKRNVNINKFTVNFW